MTTTAGADTLSAERDTDGGGAGLGAAPRVVKSESAFRTIGEVVEELGVPQHVLRFWETKFSQLRPLKRGGGRRYYRPEDIALLRRIRDLLHEEGYTIRGVQKQIREHGVKGLLATAPGEARDVPVLEAITEDLPEPEVEVFPILEMELESVPAEVHSEVASPPATVSAPSDVAVAAMTVQMRRELAAVMMEMVDIRDEISLALHAQRMVGARTGSE
ncbi:MAG: MerR family transcriptional regulator [Alphaproteobacteria bacterium]